MDGISRICLNCQAELGPDTRFCARCGQRVIAATPDAGLSLFDPPPPSLPHRRSPVASPPPVLPAYGHEPRPYAAQPQEQPPYPEALPAPTRSQQPYPPRFYEPRPARPPYVLPPSEAAAYDSQGFGAFPPPYPYQPPTPGPPEQPPRRDQRSGSSLGLLIVLLVVLVGGAATALLLARPFSHTVRDTAGTGPGSGTGTATGTAGAGPSASGSAGTSPSSAPRSTGATSPGASPGAATAQAAATRVASMLSGSAADRTAILTAYQDVTSCGTQLAAAPKVFADAAGSRRSLIASLAGLSGRATLPPALVSDLTKAWQASIAADNDYAKWADDEIAQGCVANDTGDPAYQSANGPDAQSTQDKDAFVALWNPIAADYGLTQYEASQL
jgi:hypothetical protein